MVEKMFAEVWNSTTILVVILILAAMYVYMFRGVRRKVQSIAYVERPTVGKPAMSADDQELLGVAPVQKMQSALLRPRIAQVGFPISPVMPDLNVIDGVAPFNPDIVGNEWGAALTIG